MMSRNKRPAVVVTTWMERFRQTIALFCRGVLPPLNLCKGWVAEGSDDLRLQDWVCCNMGVQWAQSIAILDAAQQMADNPVEGVGHFDKAGVARGNYEH